MRKFDTTYKDVLHKVLMDGFEQNNNRTGHKVKAIHGYAFRWNMKYWPVANCRAMFAKTGAAELAWTLGGNRSTKWLKKYTTIWNDFETEADYIETAYGHRWRHAFGVDQLMNIISKLEKDPSSRQQVLMTWNPHVDNVAEASNIPCPFTAVINIIDHKLNIHLTLRSNDVYLGLPYDVMMYTLLGNALANELGVEAGELFYSIAHGHLYDNQYNAAAEVLNSARKGEAFEIDLDWSVNDILKDPSLYVAQAWGALKSTGYAPDKGPERIKVVT